MRANLSSHLHVRLGLLLLVFAGALIGGAQARAADSIYWANEAEGGTIRVANLADGSGASILGGAAVGGAPCGVAIDPAAGTDGKIYWADFGNSAIRVADLVGSGVTTLTTGEAGACGIVVDHAAGKIYWADFSAGTIRAADLTNVAGTAHSLVSDENGPSGVAIDRAARKIYWTNQFPGTTNGAVRRANLDGSLPETLVPAQANPIGVAIDPAAGKMYWANLGSCCSGPGTIRRASLGGSFPKTLVDATNAGTAGVAGPAGVAIDPAAGKIYWANFGGGTIWRANLNGAGAAQFVGPGPGGAFSNFPVLLRAPAGTEPPAISGGAKVGRELTCSQGRWARDLLGAFLFRAPHSFGYQWQRNGSAISGANESTFTPDESGSYTCRVTASNHAGSTSRTSAVKKVKS